ncbi:hypothetical protein NE236_28620 [Actinoallomurus purpureus]|uniref:hypothetical protein n=1 Tax=Actinoallomurus purpureus TaxID=478114 RepID=UPI0020920D7F|nr:hypothetical protein [Actinoallomurus purpureus]MCO6008945.1 hypothetical protein [Actinoallomurus purpureus]
MRIPKRMALAVSGLAFAGATALTLGAAAPAGAQTVSSTPQHAISGHFWGGCGGGWGWGGGWGGGCGGGWDDCWDDCWC